MNFLPDNQSGLLPDLTRPDHNFTWQDRCILRRLNVVLLTTIKWLFSNLIWMRTYSLCCTLFNLSIFVSPLPMKTLQSPQNTPVYQLSCQVELWFGLVNSGSKPDRLSRKNFVLVQNISLFINHFGPVKILLVWWKWKVSCDRQI